MVSTAAQLWHVFQLVHPGSGSSLRQYSAYQALLCRGDVSDYVLMEGRGFGFVTFADPAHAQSFLEVS